MLSKPHEYWLWRDHTTTYSEFKKEMWIKCQWSRTVEEGLALPWSNGQPGDGKPSPYDTVQLFLGRHTSLRGEVIFVEHFTVEVPGDFCGVGTEHHASTAQKDDGHILWLLVLGV